MPSLRFPRGSRVTTPVRFRYPFQPSNDPVTQDAPSTKGAGGDPLDVLLLLDAPAFPGCVLEARLVGVIEAEQRERDGTWERNDRMIGVAVKARTHAHIEALDDLRPGMLDEVEAFFGHYNELTGKEFRVLRRGDAEAALRLVRDGSEMWARSEV